MAREERSGNGCGGSSSSTTILQFVPFCSLVDEGFWQRLSYLKLNKYGIDDSPIPITGFYAPCSHSRVSNHLTLLADSLPTDENGQSSMPAIVVTGTNALDKRSLLKEEANKIWEDIHTARAMENSVVLSRFLLILFADLEKWSFHYWLAFPALVLDPPAMLIESNVLRNGSPQRAKSASAACNDWHNSSLSAELSVVLHHPDGMFADSDIANSTSSSELPLGILPHQIRGSLFHFSQMTLVGHSSNSCTACCSTVVSEYQKRGIEFLLQATDHPT